MYNIIYMYIYISQCIYDWTFGHGAHGPVVYVGAGHPPC